MLSQEQELCQGTELWELKGDVTAAMGTVLIFSQDYHFVKGGWSLESCDVAAIYYKGGHS